MSLHHLHIDNLPGIKKTISLAFETDIEYNDISSERCYEPTLKEGCEFIEIDLTTMKAPKIESVSDDGGTLVTVTLESAHACCAVEKLDMLAYMKGKKLCFIYTTNNGQRRIVKKTRLFFNSSEGDGSDSENIYSLILIGKARHEPQYITGIAPAEKPPVIIEPPVVDPPIVIDPPVVEPTVLFFDDFTEASTDEQKNTVVWNYELLKNWRFTNDSNVNTVTMLDSKLKLTVSGGNYGINIELKSDKQINTSAKNLIEKQIKVEVKVKEHSALLSRCIVSIQRTPPVDTSSWFFYVALLGESEGTEQIYSATSPVITTEITSLWAYINLVPFNYHPYAIPNDGPFPVNDYIIIDWLKITLVP